ncbi:hypothetical protein PSPO01_14870 [Paraphaeosphaeria sporulosa]
MQFCSSFLNRRDSTKNFADRCRVPCQPNKEGLQRAPLGNNSALDADGGNCGAQNAAADLERRTAGFGSSSCCSRAAAATTNQRLRILRGSGMWACHRVRQKAWTGLMAGSVLPHWRIIGVRHECRRCLFDTGAAGTLRRDQLSCMPSMMGSVSRGQRPFAAEARPLPVQYTTQGLTAVKPSRTRSYVISSWEGFDSAHPSDESENLPSPVDVGDVSVVLGYATQQQQVRIRPPRQAGEGRWAGARFAAR